MKKKKKEKKSSAVPQYANCATTIVPNALTGHGNDVRRVASGFPLLQGPSGPPIGAQGVLLDAVVSSPAPRDASPGR